MIYLESDFFVLIFIFFFILNLMICILICFNYYILEKLFDILIYLKFYNGNIEFHARLNK